MFLEKRSFWVLGPPQSSVESAVFSLGVLVCLQRAPDEDHLSKSRQRRKDVRPWTWVPHSVIKSKAMSMAPRGKEEYKGQYSSVQESKTLLSNPPLSVSVYLRLLVSVSLSHQRQFRTFPEINLRELYFYKQVLLFLPSS